MKELEAYLQQLIESYRHQTQRLRQAAARFSEPELRRPLAQGEWSPHQVLVHVVAAEEYALLPRFERILEEETPHLEDWDQDRWMDEHYQPDQPVEAILDRFETLREGFVPRLEGLEMEEWNRSGFHPYRGQRTLLWWLEYDVHHVREHLGQLGADGEGA